MRKKIDKAKAFLAENRQLFRCPICHKSFVQESYTLKCEENHQFDLSKKGTLYFLKSHNQSEYNHEMFSHRQVMIKSGMYRKMLEKLIPFVQEKENIIDIGCGEGSFLTELTHLGMSGTKIGFDLSKDGIYLASNQPIEAFWCAADLTNLPFADQSADCLLNIFSPSHYAEFQRVLKPNGLVVKIVPETGYLRELREAFFPNNQAKQSYSNEKVIEKFSQSLAVVADERITSVFEIPQKKRLDLLEMSPLEWQADPKIKEVLKQNPLEKVTIDLRMLVGRVR
ncbi:methyltransferase domain-containing protein [Enterococcus sp. BWB1-3]|uniref:methyltransferase domain-containing protein n=1 Tax=Enterococcus sp. BWB1-3 TaxID=2787713 RepID=UPI001922E704|nr:methyltransferase domain-containing protein [Enterococcus sp. BWB1-3]MBL1229786.1 methyltransferase domain-containing protein [Enterococcus sp. BWB1-3]